MDEERSGRSLRMMKTKTFAREPNTVKKSWDITKMDVLCSSISISTDYRRGYNKQYLLSYKYFMQRLVVKLLPRGSPGEL